MSKEIREMIDKVKSFKQFVNENSDNSRNYTMYTGVSKEMWENVWKNKNLKDRETNLTTDLNFAMDYSYNFTTGEYEDLVVEIGNIPIEAFFGYRTKNYKNDNDFKSMENFSIDKKRIILGKYDLFLANLYPYKEQLTIKLIEG
jgi:hypothetical protein